MSDQLQQQFKKIVESLVEKMGIELVVIKMTYKKGGPLIDVYADRKCGGITLEECALLNKRIIEELDQEDDWSDVNYALSVSSPGLDWPLRTEKDFLRVLNREVKFILSDPIEKSHEIIGDVKEVAGGRVMVAFSEKEKVGKKKIEKMREVSVPIEKIKTAVQVL